MRDISHNGLLLATVGNEVDIPPGRNFTCDASAPLQWGTFLLEKGTILKPHIHKIRERIHKHKTIEFLYVVEGKLLATFYSLDKKEVAKAVLKKGNSACLYDGGHGFEVLESGTKFIEVKSGPFVSIEKDKEKF